MNPFAYAAPITVVGELTQAFQEIITNTVQNSGEEVCV
jgi:hypothetical protein